MYHFPMHCEKWCTLLYIWNQLKIEEKSKSCSFALDKSIPSKRTNYYTSSTGKENIFKFKINNQPHCSVASCPSQKCQNFSTYAEKKIKYLDTIWSINVPLCSVQAVFPDFSWQINEITYWTCKRWTGKRGGLHSQSVHYDPEWGKKKQNTKCR